MGRLLQRRLPADEHVSRRHWQLGHGRGICRRRGHRPVRQRERSRLIDHSHHAQNYTGWWSLGYASIANWNDVPSNYYFSGSLAQAAVIPTQLTAAQVSSLYGDTTLSSYTAGVEALSPTNYWPLNDSGAIPYEGSVPGATASTTLADYSGNSDTGTAEGGTDAWRLRANDAYGHAITLMAPPASSRRPNRIPTLRASRSWPGSRPRSTTGGTILGFTSSQANSTPTSSDRTSWLDSAGNLIWEVNNGTVSEMALASVVQQRPMALRGGRNWLVRPATLGGRCEGRRATAFGHLRRELHGLLAPWVGLRDGMGQCAGQLLPDRLPG